MQASIVWLTPTRAAIVVAPLVVPSRPASTTSPPGPPNILVVDDNADLRESLEEILEMEGYAVQTAEHGARALELLREGHRPQAILLDLMMPVMDGAEFLTRLRADPAFRDMTVLLVTAFCDRAEGLLADRVLEKPLNLPLFLELVGDVCQRRSA
jgi:CheY-like chemotaxis protein